MPKSLPALLLGLMIAFYWARVSRMAYKAKRRTGRGANFLPPEPLGRVLRLVWYPVVAVWVAHPFVVAYGRRLPWLVRPLFQSTTASWIALIFAAIALAATLVCWKRMGKSWRMGIDPAERTQLVVSGPYAYVRHPIYALSSLLMLATIVVIPSVLMLIAGGIHLLFLQWEARREEQHMLATHGQTYASYRSAVGRFIPRSPVGYTAAQREQEVVKE